MGWALCSAGPCSTPLLPSQQTLALPWADMLGWSRMSSVSHSSWTYKEISTLFHLTTIISRCLNEHLTFPGFRGTIRLIQLCHWSCIRLTSCKWSEGTVVSLKSWLTGTVDGEQAVLTVAVSKRQHPSFEVTSFGWLHASSVQTDQIPPSKVTAVLEK